MSPQLAGIGAWILFTITALMMIFILAPLIVVVVMSVICRPPRSSTWASC